MNIYEQQASNRRATYFFVALMMLLLGAVGFGFDLFFGGLEVPGLTYGDGAIFRTAEPLRPGQTPQPGNSVPYFTIIAVAAGGLLTLNSIFNGPKMILSSVMARPADPNDPQDRVFLNVLEEMSIASGLPMPKAYVIPDPDPNAFATGFSPDKSYVAVTEGLVSTLNREELQAVVAHEMAHVNNLDIRLMTMVAALGGAIVLLSDWAGRSVRFRRSRDDRGGGGAVFIIWILLVILAPILTRLLAMAISRRREYLADATGAEFTRNPLALASALEKLERASEPTRTVNRGLAHMCIVDPSGSYFEAKENFAGEMFSTHPPIQKRIEALKTMAYQRSA